MFLHGDPKIYICLGYTDMRKGIRSLTLMAESIVNNQVTTGALFVFRGKSADKIKIIWWDGQGFCLFYKQFEEGKFIWPNAEAAGSIGITKAQLSMLMEGVDWRMPRWSKAPEYVS